jgi:hypothetical protein
VGSAAKRNKVLIGKMDYAGELPWSVQARICVRQYPGPQNDVILRRVYCAEESMHFWGTQYIDPSPRCAQGQDDIASMNT